MSKSSQTGRFVWYDLMTNDVEAAQAFYTEVVGWKTQKWEGGDEAYTMWMAGEEPVGGVMRLPEQARKMGAPPHWMGYVSVPDCDAAVTQARSLGARILNPAMDIPEVGRFAVIADPQGATISLFTPRTEMGSQAGAPRLGEISWHELITTDQGSAWTFYETMFGWKKTEAMDMPGEGTYQMFGDGGGGGSIGGIFNKPAQMPGPPAWLYYARVDDVHAAIERIKQHRGSIVNGPTEVPGGDHVVQATDPQGVVFALHSSAKPS